MSSTPRLRNLTVEEARARMVAAVSPLGSLTLPLDQARGRTLAADVVALRDQPPFDASAMDGWAVRRGDAVSGGRLGIVGISAAGHPFNGAVGPGQAARIFTGAAAPPGADWIVIQENARQDGDHVLIDDPGRVSHIRPRGGDLRSGETVLRAGERLDPWRIALAAAAGAETAPVMRRPRAAILVNGEELIPPGQKGMPGQISDSGGPGLAALVELWGGSPTRLDAVGDSLAAIRQSVAEADADLIITIGGASVGDHDLVKPALAELGLRLAVETINLRPGKPTWFGVLADGRPVLGLPGNPASAFVCAQLFLQPILAAMLGRPAEPAMVPALLERDLPANGDREQWMRVAVSRDDQGRLRVTPFGSQDSSLVGVFARADALLRRPAEAPAAEAGRFVEILLLERLP